MNQTQPVKLFISYSHKDEVFKNRFDIALKPLKRLGMIDLWQDGLLLAGEEFEKTILNEIGKAEVVCLLVSPHFLNSDYCFSKEMQLALQNRRQNGCYVVPILLSSTPLWQKFEIGKLIALPKDGKPVDTWGNADEAWLNVVTKISELVEHIQNSPNRMALTSPPAAKPESSTLPPPAPSPGNAANLAPLRKKIARGNIEEAISDLLEITELQFPDEQNEVILLSNRWFSLQKREQSRTITESSADVERNSITTATLNLIRTLEQKMT